MKNSKGKKNNFRSKAHINCFSESITKLSKTLRSQGRLYCGEHTFTNGVSVPIYEVFSVHALNQLIGYAKFINRSYGSVYYRGECKIHDGLRPSIFRGRSNTSAVENLNKLIKTITLDEKFQHQLKLNSKDEFSDKNTVEAMIQHYGIKTRYLDVVDNHWVALWMGLYIIEAVKQVANYSHYTLRTIPIIEAINQARLSDEELYQYILLIAVPGNKKCINNGIYSSDDIIELDLRQALPSIFLRPHAQHGIVIRKRCYNSPDETDLSTNVIGIIKIRIDRAQEWLGNGKLLTQENLFPAPSYDFGYDMLLSRSDIFNEQFSIARYI